jgi:anti-sigma factor RsiW
MVETAALACQEMVELITDYLEERLTATDRARFEAHLAVCPHCRAYLAQMRQTIRALGVLPPETISPAATEALMTVFARWRADRQG